MHYFSICLYQYKFSCLFHSFRTWHPALLFVDNLGQPLYCPYPLWISIPAMALSHLTIAGIAEGAFTLSFISFYPQNISKYNL